MPSVSLWEKRFLGNETEGITGFGLGGFLTSFGTHHIVNNETFKDNGSNLKLS